LVSEAGTDMFLRACATDAKSSPAIDTSLTSGMGVGAVFRGVNSEPNVHPPQGSTSCLPKSAKPLTGMTRLTRITRADDCRANEQVDLNIMTLNLLSEIIKEREDCL